VGIALLSPHPFPLAGEVALAFLVIQQLESNVIGPRITGHAVGLHPLAALMALLVGIELDGILGALFAVPVAGILYVLGMAIYYHIRHGQLPELARQDNPTAPMERVLAKGILGTVRLEARESSRLRLADVLRRATPDNFLPKRLDTMNQKADALLRNKLKQRQAKGAPALEIEQELSATEAGLIPQEHEPTGT